MSEMNVTCAQCGKRYKGASGPKKFRCGACQNLYTFPETAKTPAAGMILCSFCWTEIEARMDLCACPNCAQKVSPHHGGRAAPRGLSGSGLNPSPIAEDHERLLKSHHELEAKVTELQTQLGAAVRERDDAAALSEKRAAEADEARNQLEQFRDAAVKTLEPLEQECSRQMQDLIAAADDMRGQIRKAHDEVHQRLEKAERVANDLRQRLNALNRDIGARIGDALGGGNAEAVAAPPQNGSAPAALPQTGIGPLAELLAAGVPAGAALIVSRLPKPDAQNAFPGAAPGVLLGSAGSIQS